MTKTFSKYLILLSVFLLGSYQQLSAHSLNSEKVSFSQSVLLQYDFSQNVSKDLYIGVSVPGAEHEGVIMVSEEDEVEEDESMMLKKQLQVQHDYFHQFGQGLYFSFEEIFQRKHYISDSYFISVYKTVYLYLCNFRI